MLGKGAASTLAILAASSAAAVTFDVSLIEARGDFTFTATATYWEPGINQIRPVPVLNLYGPNTAASATIVSEGVARQGWWFTGQNWLTFEGGVYWSGPPDPNQALRIVTTITDLDNGHVYTIASTLNHTGSSWGRDVAFVQPTKRVRWVDAVSMTTGTTGTLVRWVSANHTMRMESLVPEPATAFAVLLGVAAALRRRR